MVNPLASDGVPGKLTDEQTVKLKKMWKELFELVDNAPVEGSGGAKIDDTPQDEKAAQKNTPKDDDAKERQRQEKEKQAAEAALKEYGSREFMAGLWRSVATDDPDLLMLRFLRARKWSTSAGTAMMAACVRWRLSGDVEKIIEKGEEGMKDAEGFLMQMRTSKAYSFGTDSVGRPCFYIHVAKHKLGEQSPKALEDFVVFQMESVRRLLVDGVDKVTLVFDMTGFGLKNMDWRCVLFIVKCFEAYYPESLNVILVHSAPWVFQGIWKMLAPMLDPVVRAKVQMTKNTADLIEHIGEKTHIVKQLGGDNSWQFKYEEIEEGENDLQKDKKTRAKLEKQREALVKQFEKITREWADSENDETLDKKRKRLALLLRAQYFELDRYTRGRSIYDRQGTNVGNGLVQFDYPGTKGGEYTERQVIGYNSAREACLLQAAALARELGIDEDDDGTGGTNDGDDDDGSSEDEKPKKRRSKSKSRK